MSIFTKNEIEQRIETLRSNLENHDAGVFFSFTNSYYMSGVPILPWGRPTITIIPKNDDPIIISGKADEQNISSNSPIKNVITYGDIEGPNVNEAISNLADVMQKLALKKIGIDGLYTPIAYIELLKAKQPLCQVDDITDILEDMRLINTAEEVEIIRTATSIADFGMETYLSEAKLGMTEIELAGRVTLAMARFTASNYKDKEASFKCYSQQGTHSLEPHAGASGNPLVSGQLLCVVVEATVSHYMAAVERTVALGDIPPEQQHYYDAVVSSLRKTIEICVPGTLFSELDKVGQQVFKDAGYDNFLCGTGLARGLINSFEGRIDKGNIRVYNHSSLRPNMVLSLEPYAIAPGIGAQRHCDMVLITETGNEVLSKAHNGFLRID